jgi:hypothetical protein
LTAVHSKDQAPPAGAEARRSAARIPDELRRKDRALALLLAGVPASVFAIAIILAFLVHYIETHHVFAAR